MPVNPFFIHGTSNEQKLIEDLLIEAIQKFGYDVYYLPRQLVALDDLFGEDNLSEFKYSFPIEIYFETNNGWGGDGNVITKVGLEIRESAIFVMAKKRWDELVGQHGKTILPKRPCEGDLIYFKESKSLLEIKFVDHDEPFFQLSQLPVYKLHLETFQFSQETIETDDYSKPENYYVDLLNHIILLESGDKLLTEEGSIIVLEEFTVDANSNGYGENQLFHTENSREEILFDVDNPFGEII